MNTLERTEEMLARCDHGVRFTFYNIVLALEKHYALLDLPMPRPVRLNNLHDGYARIREGRERDKAYLALKDEARNLAWQAFAHAETHEAQEKILELTRYSELMKLDREAFFDGKTSNKAAAYPIALPFELAHLYAAELAECRDWTVLKYIEVQRHLLDAFDYGLGWFFPLKDEVLLAPAVKPRL